MNRLITLLTDFGLADEYAGVMKGVILSRFPSVRLIDLTHQIPPQDLRRAAYLLDSARPFFPAGTLHVVVVDPGVGTSRRIILVEAGQQLFLAPDNGVLTRLIGRDLQAAYEVSCRQLFLQPVSGTFHGRDIFAPVAAELARGMAPREVGKVLNREELVTFAFPEPVLDPDTHTLRGQVVSVDHFGNLLTNISWRDCRSFMAPGSEPITVRIRDRILPLVHAYGAVPPGGLLALFGSRDFLEIAINQGNASRQLAAGPDEKVQISWRS